MKELTYFQKHDIVMIKKAEQNAFHINAGLLIFRYNFCVWLKLTKFGGHLFQFFLQLHPIYMFRSGKRIRHNKETKIVRKNL